jgi:hypothetical protein
VLPISIGGLVQGNVVHPIHTLIMTFCDLRVPNDLTTTVQEYSKSLNSLAPDLESSQIDIPWICVLRRALIGRRYHPLTKGDRLTGLQLRLFGPEDGGVYP